MISRAGFQQPRSDIDHRAAILAANPKANRIVRAIKSTLDPAGTLAPLSS